MKRQELLDVKLAVKVVKMEQKIASKYGQALKYKDTESYKNFSGKEKKKVDSFLTHGKIPTVIAAIFTSLLASVFLFANNNVTGHFVFDNIEGLSNSRFNVILIILILVGVGVAITLYCFKHFIGKRFRKLFGIIEKTIDKK